MKKIFYLFALFCCFFGLSSNINASTLEITNEERKILKQYINDEEVQTLSERAKEILLNNDVVEFESMALATTYYSDNTSIPRIIKQEILETANPSVLALDDRCEVINSTKGKCETDYKIFYLYIENDSGRKRFRMLNTWKKTPKYKSFDVIAFRWTGDFSLEDYTGNQYTNGNTNHVIYYGSSSNFKTGTKGVGLSQNLVDSATQFENELVAFGTCTNGGTLYATYQHAQANITLATSKSYSFSSSGMGGVLNFTGNAVGIYDNTPGISLSYTC